MRSHIFLFGSLPRRPPPELTAILTFEFWREATATSVPGLLWQSGRRRHENVSILSSLFFPWRENEYEVPILYCFHVNDYDRYSCNVFPRAFWVIVSHRKNIYWCPWNFLLSFNKWMVSLMKMFWKNCLCSLGILGNLLLGVWNLRMQKLPQFTRI